MAKQRRPRTRVPAVTAKSYKLGAAVVEQRRKQFEAGQDWALLDAVNFCARERMAMPVWLVNAFCDRYMKWYLFKVRTLDEAFGVERPKRARIKDRARHEWLKPRVVLEVMRLREDNVPFGDGMFERVGEKLGVGKTQASDAYYDSANQWRTLFERSGNHWRKLLERIAALPS